MKPSDDQNRTEHNKKAVLAALEKSLGVVTTACKAAGVGRTQYYTWLKEDPEFAAQVKDLDNIALDFVESQLFLQIQNGEVSSTIFYLKTKGKHRGYIEKVQQEVIQTPRVDKTVEELMQELNELESKIIRS